MSDSRIRKWAAYAFVYEETGIFPEVDANLELLREIYALQSNRYGSQQKKILTVAQIEVLVSRFRSISQPTNDNVRDPDFGSNGETYLRRIISTLGNIKTQEATDVLKHLTVVDDGFTPLIKTILSEKQNKLPAPPAEVLNAKGLKAMLLDGLPQTPSQLLALGEELFEDLTERAKSSETNTYRLFYRDPSEKKPKKGTPEAITWNQWDRPKKENDCNQVVAEVLRPPSGVIVNIELQMANEKEADIGFQYSDLLLPIEAKGQWNGEVYSSAMSQLDAKYAAHFQAKGFGIFLIYWFGHDVTSSKKPAKCPVRKERPRTSVELKEWVIDTIPTEHRNWLKVVVLDVVSGTKA